MHAILIAGAALVGLPILLHLIMKQEPKRLTFPAFRFLTQKLKTNQRKLRLRHFLLLALRMLLIALFCLALYQPTLKSDRLNIRGEQPVATVLVIDTSPSMGFVANDKSRLDEVRRRAREFLDELPDKSPVAVVTTDDPTGGYWQDLAEARKQVEGLVEPRGGGQPVTGALAQAYQLLSAVEGRGDADGAEQLPKLVVVLTDRAAASWEAGRVEDLKKFRDRVPDPKPAHAVIDVGADKPVNVGLLGAEMRPQVIAAGQPAPVTVTVAAAGPPGLPPAEAVVVAEVRAADGAKVATDRKSVAVPYGQSRAVGFEFRGLKPGLHQVEFKLDAPDKLMFDNSRFLTFKVGEARRVLAITDTITDAYNAALYWQAGVRAAPDGFTCVSVTPDKVRTTPDGRTVVVLPDPAKPGATVPENLSGFDVVCLLSVEDPGPLWEKLRGYVRGGGKLVVIPGEERSAEGYAAGGDLMPATLKEVVDTRKLGRPLPEQTAAAWPAPRPGANGVTWFLDDQVVQHPMLRPFQAWRAKGNVTEVVNPRVAWRYWAVDKAPEGAVVVRYHDAAKEADRSPAVLERGVADPREPTRVRGRVLLLTTKMEPTAVGPDEGRNWHNYWDFEGSRWYTVFPWLVCRYLAGDAADATFNFPAGQAVTVPLPKGGIPRGVKVVINGPGIASADSLLDVGERQTELRVTPPRTNQPGNYRLSVNKDGVKWEDGFSLNVPAEEGTLEKVPAEGVEDLTGKGTVFPLDKNVNLRDVIPVILDQPIDLFPWLLILVLLLLAAEGVVANRFYRRVR